MAKTLAWAFGIVLTAVGIIGFVPGVTSADGLLLGVFQVDVVHNIIHIVTGLIGIYVAMTGNYVSLYFKVFGVVYALVTVVGFLDGASVMGLMSINMADNVLHLVIALVALWAGFWMKEESAAASPAGGMGSM